MMPEKPEVITVVKNLIPELIHKEITGCNIFWDNIIATPEVALLKRVLLVKKLME